MTDKNEIIAVILAIILLTFGISFRKIFENSLTADILIFNLVAITLIILINILGKKIAAYYFESKATIQLWEFQRYGLKASKKFNKPVPAGLILSFIIPLLSAGYAFWMAVLEFDVEGTSARASKRHEWFKFSEITDWHLGLITSTGIVANLLLAVIAYLTDFSKIAILSTYFAAFSLIPLGNLDGSKIFFARKQLWITMLTLVLIFLAYSILLA